MTVEHLPGRRWYRIAEAGWEDPLDPTYAQRHGGRWNPPDSFPVLYLNEDVVTARINLRAFIAGWPYEPEDLRDDNGPVLIGAMLPRRQDVADAHTRDGVVDLGLPATYPLDRRRRRVGHDVCRRIGVRVRGEGLRGVRCRSAQAPDGAGRELAWFPASERSRARQVSRQTFDAWFWS